jgi:2-phospho-L-lactate transferase/gluconeogenesis factor (CofD/UPF0052 family)
MTAIQGGDFEEGLRQMNRVLAVRGQVLPATAVPLTLHAELADGTVVDGQSRIAQQPSIARAWITPADVRASEDALAAIAEAETTGFDLAAHVEALVAHAGIGIVDAVLANNRFGVRVPADYAAEAVKLRWPPALATPPRLVLDDVVDPDHGHHHEPVLLAAALLRLYERESGARRRAGIARTA